MLARDPELALSASFPYLSFFLPLSIAVPLLPMCPTMHTPHTHDLGFSRYAAWRMA